MKRYLLFSIFTFTLLFGCNKDDRRDCYDRPECITGEWKWIKNCGGFSGGCWYPGFDHQEKVVFTSDGKYVKYLNGKKYLENEYVLGNTHESNGIKYYKITFLPDRTTSFWFAGKILNIPGGDFVEEYVRIK